MVIVPGCYISTEVKLLFVVTVGVTYSQKHHRKKHYQLQPDSTLPIDIGKGSINERVNGDLRGWYYVKDIKGYAETYEEKFPLIPVNVSDKIHEKFNTNKSKYQNKK